MKGKRCLSRAWKLLLTVFIVSNTLTAVSSGEILAKSDLNGIEVTDYQVEILETISDNGFVHPGVGLTKPILENMREQVLAKNEPWYSYFQAMTLSAEASRTVTSSNEDPNQPMKPASDAFNSTGIQAKFISDGLKAYTQSLMYFVTGDEVYRSNAMRIIRIWSQMDPDKYEYYSDAHIHAGIPLNRMVTAAEILRYSSSPSSEWAWNDEDTELFTKNLIESVMETFQYDNSWFMNQNNYALLGAMAGSIFTNNLEEYTKRVEWFTVNSSAVNQGFNGSIKQMFRLVDTNAATGEVLDTPVVQHVEMGRDQAHGAGDLTNAAIIARMMLAQGTKVDPVEGTVSDREDAVGPYEFLNDRILDAVDYFWQYMLGYDTNWVPTPFSIAPDGTVLGIYHRISDSYKGRMNTAQMWDIYYYYTYERNMDIAERAPYFYEAFMKRLPSNYYYAGSYNQAWNSPDGGGDWWLYVPEAAKDEGARYIPKEQTNGSVVEIEDRYTAFDDRTATRQEGGMSYVEFLANPAGTKAAVLNLSYGTRSGSKLVGIRFRTDQMATLQISRDFSTEPYTTLTLPNTRGEWKYITYDAGIDHVTYAQSDKDYSLVYLNVIGEGAKVDLDYIHLNADTELSPPVFKSGMGAEHYAGYIGTPVTIDLSATDSAPDHKIVYELQNGPGGGQLDSDTGLFSWQPTQTGTYNFTVIASDGTSLAAKNIEIKVTNDRNSAVQAVISSYNANTSYVSTTLNRYQSAYQETVDIIADASDEQFMQQLIKLKAAAENLEVLTPRLYDGSMDYSSIVTSSFGTSIPMLLDGNNNTFPVYSLAPDLYHILDFGADFKITANAFSLQSRMNFVDRMAGSTIYASNDQVHWTRITSGITDFTDGMSEIEVDPAYRNTQFRFIKIQMINPQPDVLSGKVQNLMELGEFRIDGERHETNNKMSLVSMTSDQSIAGRISIGDTVKLSIEAKAPLQNVEIQIQGTDAEAATEDNLHFTGTAVMKPGTATGKVAFSIDYQTADGTAGDTVYFTTDGSKLFLGDDSDLIEDLLTTTTLIDSTTSSGRSESETLKQTGYLFDNNPSTNSDYRSNGAGSGGYIAFDFREGNQATITGVEILARQDQYYTRIKGAVLQGSNDKENWKTITNQATATMDWQMLQSNSDQAYRYIRVYNANNWFGNMAEIKLHGSTDTTSQMESVSISSDQSIIL